MVKPDLLFNIKGVIFDMDGVIVNNMPYHLQAWKEFCQKHNYHFDKETFIARYPGKENFDIIRDICGKNITREEADILGEEKEAIYREIYSKEIKPANGLIDVLTNFKELGIKLAVATSAPPSNLHFTLSKTNLTHFFDATVDASMINHGKPSPEIFLKAAHLINVPPSNCLVFEDAFAGIEAATKANMKVVALATTNSKDKFGNKLRVINDFTEFNSFPSI